MTARADAVGGALAQAVEEAQGADGEQLDLIGLPQAMKDARKGELRVIAGAARRGRPPGAQNLATRDVKDFCRRAFGYDPMIEGYRWLQHTPETLAAVLGCTRLEAFDRLEAIRRDLARFFYAPMQPVDENGKPVPFFAMTIGGAPASSGAARPPWEAPDGGAWGGQGAPAQIEQKQGLTIEAEPAPDPAPIAEPRK